VLEPFSFHPSVTALSPSPFPQAAIVAHNIEMIIRTRAGSFPILRGIDLNIAQGELCFLMGPSGSGKTTLLQVLAGMLTPTSGNVTILGEEITHLSRRKLTAFRLNHIGFIFQNFNLFSALTVEENVRIALEFKGIYGKTAMQQTQALLEQVGLAEKSWQKPLDLSGGEKQRVAIARALAGHPPIIMADEPTASLDFHSGQGIIEVLRSLSGQSGCTVLIVTHDSRIVQSGDRVFHLDDGQLSVA
jgi:putative ABC transport system ATP-binding protein